MPWFCHAAPKRKRSSNKTRVGVVGKLEGGEDSTLSNGKPMFAVVLQGFTGSIADELSVQRGQVVEVMYFDGDWSFVRNMDSSSGYIPKMYCLSIDKVKGNFNNSSSNHVTGPLPRPRVINVDTLQRSGSSVNSVEVRQINNMDSGTFTNSGSNPISIPVARTASPSSSQVIYEVPRSPVRLSEGSVCQPPHAITPSMTGEVHPEMMSSQRAPSLPPRSANLPSQAEIQRHLSHVAAGSSRPEFLPGCRQGQNPFTIAMHAPGTSGSPVSYMATPMQAYPSGQGGRDFSQSYPSPQTCLPYSATSPHSSVYNPFTIAQQHSSNSPHTTSNSTHSPSSIPTALGRRQSAPVHSLNFGGRFLPGTSPTTFADTPGSAGTPAVASSPASARVVLTPGAIPPAVTPGYATKPKFASATPPGGAIPLDNRLRWPGPGVGTNSDCAPTYRRVSSGKNRRHSSDILTDLAISEDSDVVSFSPPQSMSRSRNRRQSQPCVATMGLQNSPPRRPTRLPVRRTLSMQEPSNLHTVNMASPLAEGGASSRVKSVPIHRAPSYQEAVLSEEERTLGVTASIRPSVITASARDSCPGSRASGRRGRSGQLDSTSDTDDVFLPGVKKPYGIFQCVKPHKPKFKGEISLEKNELVIVLDRGRGEWAWAITSNNIEGLIPKSVLVRYNPDHGVGGADREGSSTDAGTQTEVLLNPPNSNNSASCDDTAPSCSEASASCNENTVSCKNSDEADVSHKGGDASCKGTPLSSEIPTHTGLDIAGRAAIVSVDSLTTTDTSPMSTARSNKSNRSSSAAADAESSDTQACPKEWFDTLDSVDAAKVVSSINMEHEGQEDLTLSISAEQSVEKPKEPVVVPPGVRKLNKAAPRKALAIPRRRKAASTLQTPTARDPTGNKPVLVKAGTVHYHDRISGMGSVRFDGDPNSPSSGPNNQQRGRNMLKKPSSMLTAVKDYTPPDSAKNCLSLEKGDVLHSQPHMHYPKGWMWVWHVRRRCFGYVPKSYIAYTYDTPPRGRHRTESVEDAV